MKILTLTFLLAFFVVTSANAQKEFFFARILQSTDLAYLDKLDVFKGQLSPNDLTEWNNLRSFYLSPFAYLTGIGEPIDMMVLHRLQKIALEKQSTTSLIPSVNTASKEEYPATVLNTAEIGSELIYALGQLLIERAEQELYNAHFKQLVKVFDTEIKYGQSTVNFQGSFYIRDLLPNCYLVISTFNGNVSPQIGQSLQTAFEQDLKEFHKNMSRYLVPQSIRNKWTFIYMTALLEAINQLTQGNHPSGVLNELAAKYNNYGSGATETDQLAIGLNLINAISESLVSNKKNASTGAYWVEKKDFMDLDVRGYEYYVCFFYLNHKNLLQALQVNPADIAQKGQAKYVKYKNLTTQVLSKINWIEAKLKSSTQGLGVLDGKKFDPDKITDYVEAMISVFDLIQPIICEYHTSALLCGANYKQLRPQIDLALTIPADIRSKDYASAFLKSYRVGESFYKQYSAKTDFAGNSSIMRYLTLANDIVQADSAEAMKNVLDAAILPVGSYQIKRKLKHTFSINAYVGVTGGYERTLNNDISTIKGGHLAPFAPVGFDYAWATENNRSHSIYLALIDLGAVANMYFTNEDKINVEDEDGNETEEDIEVQTLPELSFSNIFAPGIFFTYGLKESPLTFGTGIQMAPNLREVSIKNGADLSAQDVIRFSLFLAIDIPLFTFSKGGMRYD